MPQSSHKFISTLLCVRASLVKTVQMRLSAVGVGYRNTFKSIPGSPASSNNSAGNGQPGKQLFHILFLAHATGNSSKPKLMMIFQSSFHKYKPAICWEEP